MGKMRFVAVTSDVSIRCHNGLFASNDMTAMLSRFGYSVYDDDSAIRITLL